MLPSHGSVRGQQNLNYPVYRILQIYTYLCRLMIGMLGMVRRVGFGMMLRGMPLMLSGM
jgi:hypothetical protein